MCSDYGIEQYNERKNGEKNMLGIYFANLYMSYISESALLSQKKEQSFIPVRSYKISKMRRKTGWQRDR